MNLSDTHKAALKAVVDAGPSGTMEPCHQDGKRFNPIVLRTLARHGLVRGEVLDGRHGHYWVATDAGRKALEQ